MQITPLLRALRAFPQPLRLAANALALGCALLIAPTMAAADVYPSKPISMVVPFPAGGATDAAARLVATHLGQVLGQPIAVDNVAGAGGAIAAQKTLRSAPDGYTILAGTVNDVVLAPITNPSAGYTFDNFTPIGAIGSTAFVMVANPKLPAQNIDELLAYVRKNPGKVNVGIPGVGTLQHVAASMLEQQAKLSWTTVPYKGAAPLNADLLGGQIDAAVVTLPSAVPYIKEGKFRSLGLMSQQRDEVNKDIATINEGREIKGFSTEAWLGLFAPAKLSPALGQKLNGALLQALAKPEVREGLGKLGFRTGVADTPTQFRQLIERDDARFRKATAGLKLDR
ncbi:Bug family tripartite tricarboxylate transporter substrate binding protein [Ottowia thiooxydans]|uniref:Tripartite-type tricarboxylate transporter receptor subunit TctC n=1 Tax=Ottowia thiooxydans TaxID=219182 RepID=A0ABV2Q8S3_9BURK